MNEWDLLDFHFSNCFHLDHASRLSYIEKLEIPEEYDELKLKKELQDLLESYEISKDDSAFLEPLTGVKSIIKIMNDGLLKKFDEVEGYVILDELGQGSYGKVYLAENTRLERKVALKLSPNFGSEAKTLAALEHENILRVYEEKILEKSNQRLISLQYVSGPTLKKVLDDLGKGEKSFESIFTKRSLRWRPFTSWEEQNWKEILRRDNISNLVNIILKIGKALEHAHDQGIFHLDIKPENILLSPAGIAFLADFNISSHLSVKEDLVLGGSSLYMSPEQQKALASNDPDREYRKLDESSDIFSLGKVLFQCIKKAKDEDFNLSSDLLMIANKAMASNKNDRFCSMSEMTHALENHLRFREAYQRLKLTGFEKSILLKYPIWSLMLVSVFPHIVGSLISITYNYLRIVTLLSLEQQRIFYKTVIIYNAFVIPIGCLYFILKMKPIFNFMKKFKERSHQLWDIDIEKIRNILLIDLPKKIFILGSIGWPLAIVAFPFSIEYFSGWMPYTAINHFIVSFLLSWIISVTYSVFFYQAFAVNPISLITMGGVFGKSKMGQEEYSFVKQKLNFYHHVAGILPMVMSVLILTLDPINFSNESFGLLRLLSVALILIGLAGFMLIGLFRDRAQRFLRLFGH